ncbi:MAG TPA: hypothetical protein VMU04_08820 [Candidatus Acidoferrum sp.]|nr:hypothetical protein [Candidatus Acidoferrum sp.]
MFKIQYKRTGQFDILSQAQFDSFNPSVLDVGDLARDGIISQCVAAIFDLEGFTDFCNQIDPHLVVPEYLRDFLGWLFSSVAKELTHSREGGSIRLWCQLPFFAKFLGDGVLFLWDSSSVPKGDLGSLVVSLYEVCRKYKTDYLPKSSMMFAKIPGRLRCGIARGQVIAIGDGRDYVGACINAAARLQKLSSLSFAFSRRGFDLKSQFNHDWWEEFVLIEAGIRGIGSKELVYVVNDEYATLSPEEKKRLLDG